MNNVPLPEQAAWQEACPSWSRPLTALGAQAAAGEQALTRPVLTWAEGEPPASWRHATQGPIALVSSSSQSQPFQAHLSNPWVQAPFWVMGKIGPAPQGWGPFMGNVICI